MKDVTAPGVIAEGAWGRASVRLGRTTGSAARLAWALASILFSAVAFVLVLESVARGSMSDALAFFADYYRPGWSTVLFYAAAIAAIDGLFGRRRVGLFAAAPMLALAFVSSQKAYYIGDPVYPIDIFYVRQVIDLMPLLVRERPLTGAALALTVPALLAVATMLWRTRSALFPRLGRRGRVARIALGALAVGVFVSAMDYASYSWTRDRLMISPMVWDQKENYAFNGLTFAYALNIPMAHVPVPAGYGEKGIEAIARPARMAVGAGQKPDVIMVMSESLWDPARLPGVALSPDPLSNVRQLQAGWMFSPEFGGTTPNIEFEALTGFSNAFLPYGSIPYQQYVRRPIPSLASFFKGQGYKTRAIHPYRSFFWNRGPVYKEFGFDEFRSEETLPPLAHRGPLVSDAALTDEIIREADEAQDPFFYFVVTLQGHGPYEPNRYPDATMQVDANVSDWAKESIRTYAEGAADADRGLEKLIDWARWRDRPTVIAFWGDHLPPLGPVYVETGFMDEPVADRQGALATMKQEHETPLVIWSNRSGRARDVGTVSPSFLPYHVLKLAGMSHPYYTGFLGRMRDAYRVVDRNMLVTKSGIPVHAWSERRSIDPAIRDWRFLQYDMIFGRRSGAPDFFPELKIAPAKPAPAPAAASATPGAQAG